MKSQNKYFCWEMLRPITVLGISYTIWIMNIQLPSLFPLRCFIYRQEAALISVMTSLLTLCEISHMWINQVWCSTSCPDWRGCKARNSYVMDTASDHCHLHQLVTDGWSTLHHAIADTWWCHAQPHLAQILSSLQDQNLSPNRLREIITGFG